MLFNEWQELFRLSHSDKSKQKAIEDRKVSLEKVAGKKFKNNNTNDNFAFSCIWLWLSGSSQRDKSKLHKKD